MIDKFGLRRFLLIGPGLLGLSFLLLSRMTSYPVALIFTFIGGIGYVFVNPSAAKALTNWFPSRMRGTAIGIMKSGVNIGGGLGGAILPSLAIMIGWRNAMASVAAAAILLGTIGITLYRNLPVQTTDEPLTPVVKNFRKVLTNSSILLLGILGTTFTAIQLCVSAYLVLYLNEVLLLPVVLAGTYLTVASVGGASGRIIWGIISDRIFGGRRKPVLATIGFISASMAILVAFFAAEIPLWLLYIMVAVFGFAALGWNGIHITFLAEFAGKEQAATAVGLGLAFTSLGVLYGPPIFGYIVDLTQSYTMAWTIFAVITAIGGALVLRIPESRKGD
jgi:sugar phosphate permease